MLERLMPDFHFELQHLQETGGLIAGIDEVGRGPLAGPVSAAAVILDPAKIPNGINDSKKLSAKKREALFEAIMKTSLAVSYGQASAAEIDRLNIRQASHLAMRRAANALALQPTHVLIDGTEAPLQMPCRATPIIKGDARSLSIAAASIVAKVLRDRQMEKLGMLYPVYKFEAHSGYATKIHLEAIKNYGPSPHHRMSFFPMRGMIYGESGASANSALT